MNSSDIIRDVASTTAKAHRDEGRTVLADRINAALAEALGAAQLEREAISTKARQFARNYPEGSDGRNTFMILAEWIEDRMPKHG